MTALDPRIRRRRRAAAVAVICGAGAATSVAFGRHVATRGPESMVLQDVGIAVAIVLILGGLIALVLAHRRSR